MRKVRDSISILGILLLTLGTRAQLIIAEQGRSDYQIIMPANPEPAEEKAALELQKYLDKIASVAIPVNKDDQPGQEKEIVIGNCNRLEWSKIRPDFRESESDGILIQTKDSKLFIVGATPSATLSGVFTFLENYLGCRYYTTEVQFVPKLSKVLIPQVRDRQVPVFTYRELLFPGRYDSAYRAWHKLDSHHDGSWGMWVHTFNDLVPPEKYFTAHPEYFSEINGKRTEDGQLCLANPEVFTVLADNLKKRIEAKPEAHYWSVSQNDNYMACQCDECRKISAKYGGESGLMIWFVNQVAALFPDKVISTLAYQYTRSAPEHIKPLPNVNVMLCSIECNRSKPIETDPSSASFVKDVKDWTKLTGNILIWDYVVQFRNYISPFPNLQVLQPNLEFFADKGCKLMFQQGSSQSLSEFVDLRSYIIAKLLWDPELDANGIILDFVYGYYGDAAIFISEYINLLNDAMKYTDGDLWIYGYPYSGIETFLNPTVIPSYIELFDKAELAVKDNPEILDRVQFARLPLDFAILDISLHNVDENLTWFTIDEKKFEIKREMTNLLDTFVNRCDRLGVVALNEQGLSPVDYSLTVKQFLLKTSDRHLAIGKPVDLLTPFSPKYDAGGVKALTDGLRGINDYHFNWLGFEGEDLEAIIDLGSETDIHEISADFIQDIRSWIFLPKSLSAYYSSDGDTFTEIGTTENITPQKKPGAFINTFTIPAENISARYIKVRAESLQTCPSWHIGSGKSSWIFTDEIVIK